MITVFRYRASVEVLPPRQTTPGVKRTRIPGSRVSLTDAEWALAGSDPVAALAVNAAKERAEAEARTRFGGWTDGTAANAFLHAAWNYLIATSFVQRHLSRERVGIRLAKRFTDAHEDIEGNEALNRERGRSKAMDLSNNLVGLNLAADPDLDTTAALDRLQQMVNEGLLFSFK